MNRSNRPGLELRIAGIDVAAAIAPHLVPGAVAFGEPRFQGLTLTEKLEEEADELEFTLSNHPGAAGAIVDTIRRGAEVELALGWIAGAEVPIGLVDKGRFLVDEVNEEGPPDRITVRARSADLTGRYRKRKDRSWNGGTLSDLMSAIATDNGLAAAVHPDLAARQVDSLEQAAKSDAALVRDLGERFDAAATVKSGRLIFLPIGAETNAAGEPFEERILSRIGNARYSFTVADREEHDGAEAQWDDRSAAAKRTVTIGPGSNPRRVARKFATEGEAREAAEMAARRDARGRFEFSYEVPLGDPSIAPNQRIRLEGWRSEIVEQNWLVSEVSHTLDGGSGLRTSLSLKSLA